jgi:nitrogen fixation protein NifQ
VNARLQSRCDRQGIYERIRPLAGDSANAEWLAQIVAAWCAGEGVLPDYLGLEPVQFDALIARFFPGSDIESVAASGRQSDFGRMLEKDDLLNLLKVSAHPEIAESDAIAGIVVAACLGDDHLWQDLCLWSRPELSAMLRYNFPPLAAKNVHDMKWKKFLYKQLCEAEGLHLCRAPSCAVCCDYQACFGPED